MRELKRKLGWGFLIFGIFWYPIIGINLMLSFVDFGDKSILIIISYVFIPMLIGSILLINEK